ncbi:DUF3854 domain-containing protein [Nostoc sp.]|uniref:DUF3854 domain-containing protein n=1 Tax=Nostoc sp. TaxID=1180 RepID=UPI002FF90356
MQPTISIPQHWGYPRLVNAGYRTPQDEYGTAIGKPSLIPDLKHFATDSRQVNIIRDNLKLRFICQ